MNLIKWLWNRKKFESKKEISVPNMINFFQAKWRVMLDNMEYIDRESHIKEQTYFRLDQVKNKSPECYKKGQCYCGCDILSEVWGNKGCEEKNSCYPPMMDKLEWELYKKDNNIIIKYADS